MKKQKIIIMLLTIVMALCILMPSSNAALQSNGSAGTTQLLNDWIINIRKMESTGGTLGLTETLNSNLTSSSGSNNLDIHMEKNTEYGAIAILSASNYGNPNKIASGGTTTGNETGIVMNLNKELVAAGNNSYYSYDEGFLLYVPNMKNAANKYKNIYNYSTTISPTMKGDALAETNGWHGGTYKWYGDGYNTAYFWRATVIRAYSGSVFSYNAYSFADGNTIYTKPYYSRAIMICGEGI